MICINPASRGAYHGDEEFRQEFLKELKKHERYDRLIQGRYGRVVGRAFKGCAVGCAVYSLHKIKGIPQPACYDEHNFVAEMLNIPLILVRTEESIFERLGHNQAKLWPLQFATAIQAGHDLRGVYEPLNHFWCGGAEPILSTARKCLELIAASPILISLEETSERQTNRSDHLAGPQREHGCPTGVDGVGAQLVHHGATLSTG